jgi:hypothetical protein
MIAMAVEDRLRAPIVRAPQACRSLREVEIVTRAA